jgi:hypothetical protein
MRFLTVASAVTTLLVGVAAAAAQPAPTAQSVGVNSNVNTQSTGNNRNTNLNSNSQFMSGSNTGVNNGALDVYAGADPYQGIVIESSPNLPQLPGFVPPQSNFSQPYKPESFVNGPVFLPAEMTLAEAKECRDSKVSWHGGSLEKVGSIRLFYTARQEKPDVALAMGNYVGTAMATASDRPFIAALCEAAYRAMSHGASVGVVDFGIRPKNTMFGLGFGASGGATGLPAAGAHPYAIAGTLGFGTGWSSQRVEGEVVVQLTALRGAPRSSATDPAAPSPAPGEPARDTAPPSPPATSAPGDDAASLRPAPSTEKPAGDTAPPPSPAPSTSGATRDTAPPAAPQRGANEEPVVRERPVAGAILRTSLQDASTVREAKSSRSGVGHAAPARPGRLPSQALARHPAKKLITVRTGLSKERVFDLLGTVFIEQDGRIVEVEGMRLSVSGRSRRDTRLEVSEVTLAGAGGVDTPYWFLFEEGRLVAWGSPEEWPAAAARHHVDLPYHPPARPSSLTATANVEPAR